MKNEKIDQKAIPKKQKGSQLREIVESGCALVSLDVAINATAEKVFLTNYKAPTEHLKKNIMRSGRGLDEVTLDQED